MFIQTEPTPNPATLKFLPGRAVMARGTFTADSAAEAARSPLARRLFAVEGVAGVYFGSDFVTVTKSGEADWAALKPQLLGAIMNHFTAGDPAVEAGGESAEHAAGASEADDEVVEQIKELLDSRIRPAVAQDGGDIVFHGFDKGVVYLHMRGACAGCPSSTATLKSGIENLLKHYIPEVTQVRAVQV
ncbi:MAG TPA: NifU family protein [Alphaproteobacteria bacterium]|nr:NifU family protein [Alphaproteobacteria bacterium]